MATDFHKHIGKKFNMLTILGVSHMNKHSQCFLKYRCDCGNEGVGSGSPIVNGVRKSCGCYNRKKSQERIAKFIGKSFGGVTALSFSHYGNNSCVYMNTVCSCGTAGVHSLYSIINGATCGCRVITTTKIRATKHGMYGTPIYKVFDSIKQRTSNPNHEHYKDYGGRGILCSWNSFEEFYKDMGPSYIRGLSIDRIDNNNGYSKENCRWITMDEQQRNRRNNVMYTVGKFSFCLSEWSRLLGVSRYVAERLIGSKGSQLDFIMAYESCDLKAAIKTLKSF